MKKMRKILSLVVLLAGVISFTSCGEDDATYTPVVPLEISSTDVFFEANGGTGSIVINSKGTITATTSSPWISCSVSGSTVTVVAQVNTSRDGRSALIKVTSSDGATTNVTATQKGFVFGIKGQSAYTVEGEAVTMTLGVYHISPVTVTSSSDWIAATFNGDTDEIAIQIAENTTGAGRTGEIIVKSGGMTETIEITQKNLSRWKSLGIGYYVDDIVVPMFTEGIGPWGYEVEILESIETPGLYCLVNAYATVAAAFGEPGGNENIEIHAEDPEGVYVLEQSIGLDLGYGEMSIVSEGGRYLSQYDFNVVKQAGLLGTLKDGVITFPSFTPEGADFSYQFVLFDDDGGYYAGMDEAVEIYLPEAYQSRPNLKARAETMRKAAQFERSLKAGKRIVKNVK